MKKSFALVAFLALAPAYAAPLSATVNGKTVTLNTTTIGGVSYIKTADVQKALAALSAGTPAQPAGGANQKDSVEGCMNEWLFNGIVRMRVKSATPFNNNTGVGYDVAVEFRNGTNQTITLQDAGLIDKNAKSVNVASGDSWGYFDDFRQYNNKLTAKIQQGAGAIFTYHIIAEQYPDPNNHDAPLPAAQKFLLEVVKNKAAYIKANFSVPDPSFRVDLTCSK